MNWQKAMTGLAFLMAGSCTPPGPSTPPEEVALLDRSILTVPGVGNLTLSYLRAGNAIGQRVIFVHGTPGDGDDWRDFLLRVPAGFEYIAVDRPGFGQTTPGNAEPRLERQVAAIAALLVERDGKQAILVGHSLGAPIIARLAAEYPDRVAGLLILAGAFDPSLEKIHPLQPVGEFWGIRSLVPRTMRNANRELLPLKQELEILTPLLAQIQAPISILHGSEDTLVPVANVVFMKKHFTGSSAIDTEILSGADHFLPWKHRPAIEEALSKLASR